MGDVIGLGINLLPAIVVLGFMLWFGWWVNNHVSLRFNRDTRKGRVLTWFIRPLVVVGAVWCLVGTVALIGAGTIAIIEAL